MAKNTGKNSKIVKYHYNFYFNFILFEYSWKCGYDKSMIEIYDRKFKRTAFIIFILFIPHDLYGINYITFCLETVVVWGIVIWILWFATTTNNPSCICAYNICLISLMHLLFVLSFTSLITVRTAVSATFKPRPTDPNYISYSFKRNKQRVRPQGVFFSS